MEQRYVLTLLFLQYGYLRKLFSILECYWISYEEIAHIFFFCNENLVIYAPVFLSHFVG